LPAEEKWLKSVDITADAAPIRIGGIIALALTTRVGVVTTPSCSWGIAVITGAATRA
jgi:hypothetical protein